MAKQFETFTASEIHCPRCRQVRQVRERLLLIIPNGELHAYRCVVCGETLATREVKSPPKPLVVRP